MKAEYLLYPQLILLLWGPLAVLVVGVLARPLTRRLHPSYRFVLGTALAITPGLALFVPYDASSPLRTAVPWRVPLAWGWGTTDSSPALVAQLLLGLGPSVVLASLAGSFALGLRQVLEARRTVRALRDDEQARSRVLVVPDARLAPGAAALTVGLLRPVVVLGESVVSSPDHEAVRAHELAHLRSHHALGVFLATCTLRAFWWIPGKRFLLDEVRVAAELAADDAARRLVGAGQVARALRSRLDQMSTELRGGSALAGSLCFMAPHEEVHARALALAAPRRRSGRFLTALVVAAAVVVSVSLVVLV